ncbi:MAG: iron ABC transporter permease [Proteobacteria bacterium]|nr:iron ABC transporter permease [Pseudomonadota bacterium]
MNSTSTRRTLFTGLSLALCVAVSISVLSGSIQIDLHEALQILAHQFGFGVLPEEGGDMQVKQAVLMQIRLPRVALAIITGLTLAVSGTVMQGLFRNPLADPGLMGISAGCAFGAALFAVLGANWLATLGGLSSVWALPVAAFLGGLLSTWLVFFLGRSGQRTDVATMLLAGIAINVIATAGTSALKFVADDQALRGVVFWLMGNLGSTPWDRLLWVAPVQLVSVFAMFRYAPTLNALLLGEAEAQHLGFNVERSKRILILLVALSVGLSVSLAGVIGFVGLVVPHLLRRVVGADHRVLLPASALLGAVLVLLADWLSRTLLAPTEIPVGILMALTGGPFFIWLLLTTRYRFVR